MEEEILNNITKHIKDAVIYFSNNNKQNREIWVVNEFLANLNIRFDKIEIRSNLSDPPDIIFRDARFEIKEIQDKGRRRHQEYKEEIEKSKNTKKLSDLFEEYSPHEISIQDVASLVEKELKRYAVDPTLSATLDMLFYINISIFGIKKDLTYSFSSQNVLTKWRSVSMVENGKTDFIFYANKDAPEFIRKNIGKFISST